MSSPLKWFRKHEKLLLGFFGVMLMIVFTISFGHGVDPIVDSISGQGVRSGDTLVSFRGGKLDYAELNDLRASRYNLRQLMGVIQNHTYQQNKQPQAVMIPVNQTSDEALLELVILNKEAERLGIQITDTTILNYLQQISAGTLQPKEILNIWQQVTQGSAGERTLLSLLRRELAAQKIRAMAMSGTWSVSPMRGWDYFNKLERYVSAEFLPIPVEEYIDQIPDPSETELKAYYDEFKDDYHVPGSADPGFKRRLRRSFDYVKFEYEDFLTNEAGKVSEQQVKEYYENNKEKYRETLPSADLELDDLLGDGEESTTQAEDTRDALPEENANPSPQEGAPTGGGNTSGSTSNTAGEATEEAGTDPDSDPSFTPVPQDEAEQETATDQNGDVTPPTTGDEAAGTADEKTDSSTDEEKPTYRPLDEVAESIRETIAAPIAQKNMKTAISQMQSQMERYYRKFVFWDMDKKKNSKPQPQLPDIADIESSVPLTVESMPICSVLECDSYELGQAYDLEFTQQSYRQIPFAQVAFDDKMALYQPMVFPTGEAPTKYVYWITTQEVPYTPELSEIREEVLRAWKLKEARSLAFAAAEEIAATARNKDIPLSESCAAPGRNFFQTGEITWMSTGAVGIASGALPRVSEIPGVALAGDDFRETMFGLEQGEVGVAFDAPETTVYVIRVTSKTPTTEELSEQFFNDDSHATALQYLEQSNRGQLLRSWYQDLLKKYRVTWERDPGGGE